MPARVSGQVDHLIAEGVAGRYNMVEEDLRILEGTLSEVACCEYHCDSGVGSCLMILNRMVNHPVEEVGGSMVEPRFACRGHMLSNPCPGRLRHRPVALTVR